jgi:hypothetical protein
MAEEKFSYFVSYLKDSFDQAVVWHHQTESYAVHKALGKFYDGILDLTDGLVESVSGIYDRPMHYQIDSPADYKSSDQVVKYFKSLYKTIQEERKEIYQESWVQNQVDEIATLIAETLYLLSLK